MKHLLGLEVAVELTSRFRVLNLLPSWPGRGGVKGDAFPMQEARERAEAMKLEIAASGALTVALFSVRLARAFGLRIGPLCAERVCWAGGNLTAVVVPHPSGIVRFWNSPENTEMAAALLRGLLMKEKKRPPGQVLGERRGDHR